MIGTVNSISAMAVGADVVNSVKEEKSLGKPETLSLALSDVVKDQIRSKRGAMDLAQRYITPSLPSY